MNYNADAAKKWLEENAGFRWATEPEDGVSVNDLNRRMERRAFQLTAFAAEQTAELTKERDMLKDDLQGFEKACFHCANADEYGDPIRHYHEPKGWHWHHMLDPGDGLFDPCANSEFLERLLGEQTAELRAEVERLRARLEDADDGLPLCPVHKRLEQTHGLTLPVVNNCGACALNERSEFLDVLAEVGDTQVDSVTALRRLIDQTRDLAASLRSFSAAEAVELEPLEVILSDILKALLGTAYLTTGAVPRISIGGFASIELTGVVTKANIIRVFEKFGAKQPPTDGKED